MENPIPIREYNPLIIGHRGASVVAPENTMVAFARALRDGADGIELDVRLASDGVAVVIHDSTLRRTGRVDGVISGFASKDLGQISVGDWFNHAQPEMARAEYVSETVPTLAQVFAWFKLAGGAKKSVIYVEMKTERASEADVDLPDSVVRLIKDHGLRNRVIVVSFNQKALIRIKQTDPAIQTGALFEPRRSAAKILTGRRLIAAAVDSGADEILLHRLIATRRLVEMAAERNLRSVVWTVDDPRWLRRAASLGIHALITNNPAAMILTAPT